MAVEGFYWLEDGVLAGCARPGGRKSNGFHGAGGFGAPGHDDDQLLDDDLVWLRANRIGAILSMTEAPLPEAALQRHGIAAKHLPVRDMAAPSPEQIRAALGFLDWQRAQGHGIVVHCRMGQGRTGTILAAHLIRHGTSPDDAIAQVRAVCPHAVESEPQRIALATFAHERGWVI